MAANPLAGDLDSLLDHTRELWDCLRGERLFITGGTGFFGCWLLESLAWANDRLGLGAQAVVLIRSLPLFQRKAPHLAAHPAIHFHQGDVRDFLFPTGHFAAMVHAAAPASARLNAEAPLEMLDTIVAGTRRVLDFASQCGASRCLLASSGGVYGRQPPDLASIPEDYPGAPDPLGPLSAYGEGKRLAELIGGIYARQTGLEIGIARGFTFVGPYLPLDCPLCYRQLHPRRAGRRPDPRSAATVQPSGLTFTPQTWQPGCGRSSSKAPPAGLITLARKRLSRSPAWHSRCRKPSSPPPRSSWRRSPPPAPRPSATFP